LKLGILKTDTVRPEWARKYGEYPDMFQALLSAEDPTLEFAVYDVEHREYPDDIDEVDAYLITGSKSAVYEEKPWIPPLLAFIAELDRRQKKLVGICFGHQAIAEALGGRARKSSKGWGVGLHTHTFTETPEWHDGGPPAVRVLVSHQDQVEQLPPRARLLAASDFCEYAALQIDDHILAFQGHPEFPVGYSRAIMDFRRETIGEQTYREGVASLEQKPEGARMARWILAFLAS